MEGTMRADTNAAMGTIVRTLAIAASAILAISFLMFAWDEVDRGSKEQQQAVGLGTGNRVEISIDPAPTAEQEALREQSHSAVREAIDDADDVLLQPFAGLVESDSNWVIRGVPTLIGLLVYGVGLGLLANFLPRSRDPSTDWRTAS
jgi:hypothetical protein